MNLFPKNLIRIFLAALLLTSPFLFSAWAGAPPTPMWGGFPPSENPHPPKTPAEQRRVDFAVQEIRAQYGSGVEIKFPHVIPWSYQDFLQNRKKPMPPSTPVEISGTESTSMAPVLKFDEYMVHAYVRFPNDERWYHLDVIMSEDDAGHFTRRGFFKLPIPPPSYKMPKGIVC